MLIYASGMATPTITNLDQLLEFREVTERISAYLGKRLKDHLAALSPLLAPGRIFGKYVGSRESSARADEALAELTEKYRAAAGSPFDLKADLDDEILGSIGSSIQIYPYEYTHEDQAVKPPKLIAMTSPVRWVVTYGSEYSWAQVRMAMQEPGMRRPQPLRQFVVNALAFQVVLGRNPGAAQLLKDLRWETASSTVREFEHLPLATFSMQLPSFRPADELLLTAVRLSGVPAFIEVIDMEAIHGLDDPLRLQIESLAGGPLAAGSSAGPAA